MTTIDERSFTCPVDGREFADQVVMSTNQMGQQTDFKPLVGGLFPFPFYVHACPSCGFAGYEDDFDREYPEEFKRWAKSELAPELASGPLTGALKYILAARCALKMGKAKKDAADLFLRGAWCAQEEELAALEMRCRREAASLFEEALASREIAPEERAVVTYLVGELHRRLGDAQTARAWFDAVPGEVSVPDKYAWLLRIAMIQKKNPLERFPEDMS